MKFKILFILLLLITTTDQVPLSRGERAIFFPLVVVGIASLIITPIIVGSVTAGYFIAYTFRDKDGERCRFMIYLFVILLIIQMKSLYELIFRSH